MHEEIGGDVIELLSHLFAERFAGDVAVRAPLIFGAVRSDAVHGEGMRKLVTTRG
ncbi:MAG: hypothetical protein U0796_00220 [Gemmatales bacterium]